MKNIVDNYASLSLLTLVLIVVVVLFSYRSSRNDTADSKDNAVFHGLRISGNFVGYWASEKSSPEVKTGEPSMDSVEQKSRVSMNFQVCVQLYLQKSRVLAARTRDNIPYSLKFSRLKIFAVFAGYR